MIIAKKRIKIKEFDVEVRIHEISIPYHNDTTTLKASAVILKK